MKANSNLNMMMRCALSVVLCLLCIAPQVKAQDTCVTMVARVGYNIGGTAPLGMPASIRQLNKFPLQPNLMLALEGYKTLKGNWGVLTGIRFESKGMETDCTVKTYHMDIVRGGESLEGVFTGRVNTHVSQWMFTVPLQATYRFSKVMLKFGPYLSFLTHREFSGYAYDGYLRVGNPTGEKVNLGSAPDERGDYEFSEYMRRLQPGLMLGADWQLSQHFGLFADLSWGLQGIHKSSFTTIEQTLYPIFGTIGVTYTIK